MSITVVVPSIREECWKQFWNAWTKQFDQHRCNVIRVIDGEDPTARIERIQYRKAPVQIHQEFKLSDEPEQELRKLICNYSPACRNYGFFLAEKFFKSKFIMTFDDDCLPWLDTIQSHLDALKMKASLKWFETATVRMRGFPISQWRNSPVKVSHGGWSKVPDLDAPSQLILGTDVEYQIKKGIVPYGIHFPFCGMNVAFRREVLPYMYYAPVHKFEGAQRFDDIWCGLYLKRAMDDLGWGIASGYAMVEHDRASDVFKNLKQEAVGLEINETLWDGIEDDLVPEEHAVFFDDYRDKRDAWEDIIKRMLEHENVGL